MNNLHRVAYQTFHDMIHEGILFTNNERHNYQCMIGCESDITNKSIEMAAIAIKLVRADIHYADIAKLSLMELRAVLMTLSWKYPHAAERISHLTKFVDELTRVEQASQICASVELAIPSHQGASTTATHHEITAERDQMELEKLRCENILLKNNIDELEQSRLELTRQTSQVATDLNNVTKLVSSQSAEIKSRDCTINNLREINTELMDSYKNTLSMYHDARDKLYSVKTSKKDHETTIIDLQTVRDDLMSVIADCNNESKILREQLRKAHHDRNELMRANAALVNENLQFAQYAIQFHSISSAYYANGVNAQHGETTVHAPEGTLIGQ